MASNDVQTFLCYWLLLLKKLMIGHLGKLQADGLLSTPVEYQECFSLRSQERTQNLLFFHKASMGFHLWY